MKKVYLELDYADIQYYSGDEETDIKLSSEITYILENEYWVIGELFTETQIFETAIYPLVNYAMSNPNLDQLSDSFTFGYLSQVDFDWLYDAVNEIEDDLEEEVDFHSLQAGLERVSDVIVKIRAGLVHQVLDDVEFFDNLLDEIMVVSDYDDTPGCKAFIGDSIICLQFEERNYI